MQNYRGILISTLMKSILLDLTSETCKTSSTRQFVQKTFLRSTQPRAIVTWKLFVGYNLRHITICSNPWRDYDFVMIGWCDHSLETGLPSIRARFPIMVDIGGYVILLAEEPDKRIKLYGKYWIRWDFVKRWPVSWPVLTALTKCMQCQKIGFTLFIHT